MKRILAWFSCLLFLIIPTVNCYSQTDSCNLHISLLTCSPGEELYSSFGHTAIRVNDQATGMDIVFNYGTFDDSDPYFYVKFTRGLMEYALSAYSFRDFQEEYRYQNRSVIEQTLQLSCEEKNKLFESLKLNAQEANRYYLYYFLDDNCTTRAKDMIKKSIAVGLQLNNILPSKAPTFRNLIHEYLNKSDQPWSKLGIDILLGSRLDRKVTNEESMFLPDYLLKGFDSATIASRPLVVSKQTVVHAQEVKPEKSWFTPMLFFSLLFIVVALLTWLGTKWAQRLMTIFDRVFFFLLGLLGLLLITLWIIRIDTVCRDNFNLLWALPSHIYIAFVLNRNTRGVRKYFRVTMVVTALLAIVLPMLPQQMNPDLYPILLIILARSFFRSKKP